MALAGIPGLVSLMSSITTLLGALNSTLGKANPKLEGLIHGHSRMLQMSRTLLVQLDLREVDTRNTVLYDELNSMVMYLENLSRTTLKSLDKNSIESVSEVLKTRSSTLQLAMTSFIQLQSKGPHLNALFSSVGSQAIEDLRSLLASVRRPTSMEKKLQSARWLTAVAGARIIHSSSMQIIAQMATMAVGGSLHTVRCDFAKNRDLVWKRPLGSLIDEECFATIAAMHAHHILFGQSDGTIQPVLALVTEDDGLAGIVMEVGSTVSASSVGLPAMNDDVVACMIVRAFLQSIVVCWAIGVVHADPKLENLLFLRGEKLFGALMDWGIVQGIGEMRERVGTHGHMTQDHFLGNKVTIRSYIKQVLRIINGQVRTGHQQQCGGSWVAVAQKIPTKYYMSSLINQLVDIANSPDQSDGEDVEEVVTAIYTQLRMYPLDTSSLEQD